MNAVKTSGTHAIQPYQPKLSEIPGWQSLNSKKQGELYEISQNIHQRRQISMLGEFGNLMDLQRAEQILEGEDVVVDDFVHHLYPERHQRTIDRKREVFRQIVAKIPPEFLNKMTKLDTDVLSRFERIASAALGDIRNAVLEIPANVEKNPEKYLEELDTKLLEHRQSRQKGKTINKSEELAKKLSTNALIHYARGVPDLKTSAQIRKYLTTIFGWTMEALGVTGTLRVGRIPVPDGIIIRRGRPRKSQQIDGKIKP